MLVTTCDDSDDSGDRCSAAESIGGCELGDGAAETKLSRQLMARSSSRPSKSYRSRAIERTTPAGLEGLDHAEVYPRHQVL